MKIRAYVHYDEYNNIHRYRDFEIEEKVPVVYGEYILKVEEVKLDIEQGRDEVWDYNYYKVEELSYADRQQYEWELDMGEDVDEHTYSEIKYIAVPK